MRSPAASTTTKSRTQKTPTTAKSQNGSKTPVSGRKSPARTPRDETQRKTPVKTTTDTPCKDVGLKKEANDLDELNEQIHDAIYETKDLINAKIERLTQMIQDLKNDFTEKKEENETEKVKSSSSNSSDHEDKENENENENETEKENENEKEKEEEEKKENVNEENVGETVEEKNEENVNEQEF